MCLISFIPGFISEFPIAYHTFPTHKNTTISNVFRDIPTLNPESTRK